MTPRTSDVDSSSLQSSASRLIATGEEAPSLPPTASSTERDAPFSQPVSGDDDGRLQMLAKLRLNASSYADLRALQCTCENGVVTIRGRLRTYYLKQLAQDMVRRIDGVHRVFNQIIVE